ncbi:unnamed protein product, partial [Symbiodinium microadriaticum]
QMRCQALEQTVVSYGTALNAVASQGAWHLALHLLLDFQLHALPRSVIAGNAAISACDKGVQWSWALHLFEALHTVDDVSCSAVASGCSRGHQWPSSMSLLSDMQKTLLQGATAAFNAAWDWADEVAWRGSLELLRTLRTLSLRASETSAGASLRAASPRWPLSLSLLEHWSTNAVQGNTIMLNSAIAACVPWPASCFRRHPQESSGQWPLVLGLLEGAKKL